MAHFDVSLHLQKLRSHLPTQREVGWDSIVSIATCYRLGRPGIKYWWGRFFATVQTAPGAHPASYTMDSAPFSGVKWMGCGINHPPKSNTKVRERIELHLYSPSYAFMASYTVNFTLQIEYALKFHFSSKCVLKASSTYNGQAWESTEVMVSTS